MYVNTSLSAELRLCMFARAGRPRIRTGPRGVSNLGISSSHPSVGAFGNVRPEFWYRQIAHEDPRSYIPIQSVGP